MQKLIFNGKMMDAGTRIAGAGNRGLRYGDGVFETMKMVKGDIVLSAYHWERLFLGLQTLRFHVPKLFTEERLLFEIKNLCQNNGCSGLARIRLMVFRGDGGLYDAGETGFNYAIEAWPLQQTITCLNENGLVTGIYPDAKKSCDQFSAVKSCNFLPYIMAAIYAREKKWNDCLVLNRFDRISDSTIANLFIVKKGTILTPGLSEGCIAGVMRRYLLEKMSGEGYDISESAIHPLELSEADEIFLTNSTYGIRWVKEINGRTYGNEVSASLFKQFISPFYLPD